MEKVAPKSYQSRCHHGICLLELKKTYPSQGSAVGYEPTCLLIPNSATLPPGPLFIIYFFFCEDIFLWIENYVWPLGIFNSARDRIGRERWKRKSFSPLFWMYDPRSSLYWQRKSLYYYKSVWMAAGIELRFFRVSNRAEEIAQIFHYKDEYSRIF